MEPRANRPLGAFASLPSRAYLAVAGVCGSLLVVLAVFVGRSERPTDTELDLLRRVVDLPDVVRSIGEAVMRLAEVPSVLAVTVALVVAGMRRQAVVVLGCCAAARIGYEVAKDVVSRPRPTSAAVGHPLFHGEDSFAFPSGHVTIATTLTFATVVFLVPRAAVITAVVVAALTGLGRLSLGAHWPLDVVGGFLLGMTAVGLGLAIAGPWARRDTRDASADQAVAPPHPTAGPSDRLEEPPQDRAGPQVAPTEPAADQTADPSADPAADPSADPSAE